MRNEEDSLYINKGLSGSSITTSKIIKHMKILGWNCCSITSVTNIAYINRYLEVHKPDILMLNECRGMDKKKIVKVKGYKVMYNNGSKVGVIYNDKYNITQIMQELNDDNNLILKLRKKIINRLSYIIRILHQGRIMKCC